MDVTLIPGSGNGVVATVLVRELVARLGGALTWDETNDVEGAIASLQRTRVGLKGKWVHTPKKGVLPPSIRFRKALGIDTIVRHVKAIPGLPARNPAVDLVIVREASEDIYAGFEHESADGVFESVKVTTQAACERVHRAAFDLAVREGRKKVTTVHKANIMKRADGMFLRVGQAVAKEYPGIEHSDVIVDALCMDLVRRPTRYDVLVAGNLFGDIVSDCAAGMAGGATVATGKNLGPGLVVFENPHEPGPDAARVNPYPMLRLAADLLRHAGDPAAAARLDHAVAGAIGAGVLPPDVGGSSTTSEIAAAVTQRL